MTQEWRNRNSSPNSNKLFLQAYVIITTTATLLKIREPQMHWNSDTETNPQAQTQKYKEDFWLFLCLRSSNRFPPQTCESGLNQELLLQDTQAHSLFEAGEWPHGRIQDTVPILSKFHLHLPSWATTLHSSSLVPRPDPGDQFTCHSPERLLKSCQSKSVLTFWMVSFQWSMQHHRTAHKFSQACCSP